MRSIARVVLPILCLLSSDAGAQALVCPETPILRDGFEPPDVAAANVANGDIAATLDLHNCMRSQVSPAAVPPLAPLSWSTAIATTAQTWVSQCNFAREPGLPYGENTAFFSGGTATVQQATQLWVAERVFYDYAGNTCAPGQICGHYTQIVWRSTTQVGCGRAVCNTGNPFGSGTWTYIVCRYDPPGNVNGQRPY